MLSRRTRIYREQVYNQWTNLDGDKFFSNLNEEKNTSKKIYNIYFYVNKKLLFFLN